MMNECKKYLDLFLPMKRCNFNCSYCYVEGKNGKNVVDEPIKYSVSYIRKALSYERLGGVCIINICADGETLLHNDLFQIVKNLLEEGHFVSVVTNGTFSKKLDAYLDLPTNLLERMFFKFSYHYLELKRTNLLTTFFENVNKVKNSVASFTVELPASDDFVPYIDEIKSVSLENLGAYPHVTILRDNDDSNVLMTKYTMDEYKRIWGTFSSNLFDVRAKYWNGGTEGLFCYAGYFTGCINLSNGLFQQCYFEKPVFVENVFNDLSKEFPKKPIGFSCPVKHCRLCHAFLAFGDKPDIEMSSYAEVRNRICTDGSEWLKEPIKTAFKSKLYETNKDYQSIRSNWKPIKKHTFKDKLFSIKLSKNEEHLIFMFLGIKFSIKVKR